MNEILELIIAVASIIAALMYFGLSIAVSVYILHSIDAHILAWVAYAGSQVLVVLMMILKSLLGDDF